MCGVACVVISSTSRTSRSPLTKSSFRHAVGDRTIFVIGFESCTRGLLALFVLSLYPTTNAMGRMQWAYYCLLVASITAATQTQRNSTAFTLYAHNGDVDTWYDTTLVTNRLNASHESRRFIYIHTYIHTVRYSSLKPSTTISINNVPSAVSLLLSLPPVKTTTPSVTATATASTNKRRRPRYDCNRLCMCGLSLLFLLLAAVDDAYSNDCCSTQSSGSSRSRILLPTSAVEL